jgi:hypothetical protein
MQSKLGTNESLNKYPCPDCRMCQGCSESRCRSCRAGIAPNANRKLSIEEQIALFNRLNPSLFESGGAACRCHCREDPEVTDSDLSR